MLRGRGGCSYKNEGNQWKKPAALTGSSDCNSTHGRAEYELELREQDLRNCANRISEDTDMKHLAEAPKEAVAFAVGERIPQHPPLDRADGDSQEARIERSNAIETSRVARVGEPDSRDNKPAEDGAHKNEKRIDFVAGFPSCLNRHGAC